MPRFCLTFFLFLLANITQSQKPAITTEAFGRWTYIRNPSISNDGNYVLYYISNKPKNSQTLILKSTNKNWKFEVPGGRSGKLTADSKIALFKNKNDSLGILYLGDSVVEYISDVSSFRISKNGHDEWLACQFKNYRKEVLLKNLLTGKQRVFSRVNNYFLSDGGKILLLQAESFTKGVLCNTLQWINLLTDSIYTVWHGEKLGAYTVNLNDNQLAFFSTGNSDNNSTDTLWYYREGEEKTELLLTDSNSALLSDSLIINSTSEYPNFKFSIDEERIFINLKEKGYPAIRTDVNVDIWSYKDAKLQSQQLNEIVSTKNSPGSPSYSAVIDLKTRSLFRIEYESENIFINAPDYSANDDSVLVISRKGDSEHEWNWNSKAYASVYLVSTKNAVRRLLKEKIPEISASSYTLSPNHSYYIYYDANAKNYFSFTFSSGILRNITKGIKARWTERDRNDLPASSYFPIGVAGFIEKGKFVLIYDQNDIIMLDPMGKFTPVNLTNNFGRTHNLEFRITNFINNSDIKLHEQIILSAFNQKNKTDGFYQITAGKKDDPRLLTMQSCIFTGPHESQNIIPVPVLKAGDKNMYLVRRMSALESPNYFCTSDFKKFMRLSDNHPELDYNWVTTELIDFKTLEGGVSQGILYKPENFNPNHKYPIIFYYYEKLSETLNEFIEPGPSIGPINIPFFVSNGYLVFIPDIHYNIGYPGKSAYNTIVSAARYFSKCSWVNKDKMGIQGHSFGGFETNYIITHTDIFAAAMSASGMSDFISCYGSIIGDGTSRQRQYELYRDRMGGSIWQKRGLYIDNSPVFRANKVTTPVLLMNNKADKDVPFEQGVEFFTALRRLGKKSWMLQYDNYGHDVFDKSALDFSVRVAQFFDHYLKGIPPPIWMTEGIKAKFKGIKTGLELDKSGTIP
jgi:hypothetical protein